MKIQGPGYSFTLQDGLTAEQRGDVAHTICRFLIDPPQMPKYRRAVAVGQCLALYQGSKTARARELSRRYSNYLSGAWPCERDLENLPHPRSTERFCLHRLARLNGGRSLGWRQLDRICGAAVTLPQCYDNRNRFLKTKTAKSG